MAATTPRISSIYIDDEEEYFPSTEVEEGTRLHERSPSRTPLDRTIDKIGMGPYQWVLVSLCGFGWLADNMWLQTVAIILPRVQRHYDISDNTIGVLSASVFAGMMIGAVVWGTCSDLLGRISAFNGTLVLTSLFGVLASVSRNFFTLCLSFFFLGSAVGGSMPTDGTLLLEHMPRGKQYLVTALSVFFSFGAVVSALVAILVVPGHSCTSATASCDPDVDNRGWQYLLQVLAGITMIMFLSRITFFRLYESPRYLVHAGRPQEAIVSLQKISEFNGEEMSLNLEDVQDKLVIENSNLPPSSSEQMKLPSTRERQMDYQALRKSSISEEPAVQDDSGELVSSAFPSRSMSHSRVSSRSLPKAQVAQGSLPRWIRKPLHAWFKRLGMVLSPEWRRTTILVWIVWWSMSLAFTMFNVYLPKLLENRIPVASSSPNDDLKRAMWDIVIFTLGGCPGALVGAWLQELPLGRRMSLALSTIATAFLCWVFLLVNSEASIRFISVGISLSASTMWAILYGWTPAIFSTNVRGTACGSASAFSRIGGIMAPLVGGWLMVLDTSFPVYFSVAILLGSSFVVLCLREQPQVSGAEPHQPIH